MKQIQEVWLKDLLFILYMIQLIHIVNIEIILLINIYVFIYIRLHHKHHIKYVWVNQNKSKIPYFPYYDTSNLFLKERFINSDIMFMVLCSLELINISNDLSDASIVLMYLLRSLWYLGHSNKKWHSFSTTCISHILHILPLTGIFGLSYLPVSMRSLWALILNLVRLTLAILSLTIDK